MPEGYPYSIEINLTRSKWVPKTLAEVPDLLSHAFETHVTLKEIRPLVGTDHVVKWPLHEDSDIPTFLEAKSQLNEAFAEKVIKFTVPRGLMPPKWRPKKVKILAKGAKMAKYFGEDTVGTRQVEVSLKLFDCGHFYLKQSLPGSGALPYQIIFEGTWSESERGFKLKYHLRYTGQTGKSSEVDTTVQPLPPNQESMLATGEAELKSQLNGLVPAIAGEDQWCRVEIYREPDVVEDVKTRFNDEAMDPPSWKDPTPRIQPREFRPPEDNVPARPAETAEPQGQKEVSYEPASSRTAAADRPAAAAELAKDEEPMWPLVVGLAFFVFLFAMFTWRNWEEGRAAEASSREEW